MKKAILIFGTLVLAACGQYVPGDKAADTPIPPPPAPITSEPAPNANTPPQPTSTPAASPTVQAAAKRVIDWSSARADLARSGDGNVTIQSADEPPAEVPVLLPTGIAISQSADDGLVYRNTPDGYFAFYPGAVYNTIVNGTNEAVASEIMAADNPEKAPVFSVTTGGAQVWLTRYGADYTVDFECNAVETEGETCITEEDAMDIVDRLIVARSR